MVAVYKFEGKERDTETGNDDFGARYYSNRFGRWLSADWSAVPAAVPYANLTNPQTLNLYSTVADDPESFADLDGHGAAGTSSATTNPGGTACIDNGTEVGVCPPPISVTDKQAAQAQNLAAESTQQAILNIAVIRSDNLSELGQKDVNAQIAQLTADMAKMGIQVNVVSDTTVKNLDLSKMGDKLTKGAFNIVAVTQVEAGWKTSGSGTVTANGTRYTGAVINEVANHGDRRLMSHEVMHQLSGDNASSNPTSFSREMRVDFRVWKLEHPFFLRNPDSDFIPFRKAATDIQ